MKNEYIYLAHILEAINDIAEFTAEGERDKKTFKAVICELEIIGEATNRLPAAFRQSHTDVPWRDMIDMRNALSHGYDSIRDSVVWSVVELELPRLKRQISDLIDSMQKD